MARTSVIVMHFLLVSLMVSYVGSQFTPATYFNFSYPMDEFLAVYEEQEVSLVITLIEKDPAITTGELQLRSADPKIFAVGGTTDVLIESIGTLPVNISLSIKGLFIGISALEIYYTGMDVAEEKLVGSYIIKVLIIPTVLTPVFSYLTLTWLIISYIMMGSKMRWSDIWSKIKKPWVLLLAMACQFFLMPALAFGLSKAFQLDNYTALGLILVGSCPGGWLSNIFSLLLDCDFILSLTMTFCSTVMAMGMMPFNLWLYARPLATGNENLETPYLELFLQIMYLIIPIGLSMLIARFSKKFRKYCDKLLKPVATICILVAVGVGFPAQLHIFQSARIQEYAVSVLLPLFGCIAGLIISKIVCLERKQAVTVSLETGAQNSLLATTVLSLFYPKPEADLIAIVPFLMALFSLVEGLLVTIIYILARYVFCKERFAERDDDDGADDEDEDANKAEAPADLVDGFEDIPLENSLQDKTWAGEEGVVTAPSSIVISEQTNAPSDKRGHVNVAFTK